MIATAIAYTMTAIFALLGIASIVNLVAKDMEPAKTFATFIIGMMFFGLAWGCAYLGGI